MSGNKSTQRGKDELSGSDNRSLKLVELTGKDPSRWTKYRKNLFNKIERIAAEAIRRVAAIKGPRARTVLGELEHFAREGLNSLDEFLKNRTLVNQKLALEIERERNALAAEKAANAVPEVDALAEARIRKAAYTLALDLIASGKIVPVSQGTSMVIVVKGLSEDDMSAFTRLRGLRDDRLDSPDAPAE